MSANDYWEDSDPSLFWAYRSSFIRKQEHEMRLMNHNAWLSGFYINKAVSVVIHNAFCRKNEREKLENYFEEPIDFEKQEEDMRKVKEIEHTKKVEHNIVSQVQQWRNSLRKV